MVRLTPPDGSWVVGRWARWSGPDIAITQDGLSARGPGLAVRSNDFPSGEAVQIALLRGEPAPEQVKVELPVPVGIDLAAWEVGVQRATRAHPANAFRGLSYAPWMPPNSEVINSENAPYLEDRNQR